MCVFSNHRLPLCRKSTATRLNIDPPCHLHAHLALIPFALIANQMSAPIRPHPLPRDLLGAQIAAILLLHPLHYDLSQPPPVDFMIPPRAQYNIILLLHGLIILWRVLDGPEGCLGVLHLIVIKLILPNRSRLKIDWGLRVNHPLLEVLPDPDVGEALVLLEKLHLLGLVDLLFLHIHLHLPLCFLLELLVLLLLLFLLCHQELEDTHLAEDVPLLADHWVDHALVADGAHVEGLLGVLPHPLFDGAVESLQHLSLSVGEDVGGGVVFGMLAHWD